MKRINSIDIEIGKRIRAHRAINQMSQETLGDVLGVTFQQVQKYEKGVNRVSGSRLVAVAKALKTTVAQLAGEGYGKEDNDAAEQLLGGFGAVRLLHAFSQIESTKMRSAVIRMVECISEDDTIQ